MVAVLGWKLFSLLIVKKSNLFLGLHRKQQSYSAQKNRGRKTSSSDVDPLMMSFYLARLTWPGASSRACAPDRKQPGFDQQFLLMQSA
jgi:hypothetical protein